MDKFPDSITENYLYLSTSRIDSIASFPIKKFWPCWEVDKDINILWVMLKYMRLSHPEWLYSINLNQPRLLYPKNHPE